MTAPDTLNLSGPPARSNQTMATFSPVGSEPGGGFECVLDGAPQLLCSAPFQGLGEGWHTFLVAAVDAAGNTDPTPVQVTWFVDLTSPDASITSGPSGSVASTQPV